MNKTLLATLIASTLALTACGEKTGTQLAGNGEDGNLIRVLGNNEKSVDESDIRALKVKIETLQTLYSYLTAKISSGGYGCEKDSSICDPTVSSNKGGKLGNVKAGLAAIDAVIAHSKANIQNNIDKHFYQERLNRAIGHKLELENAIDTLNDILDTLMAQGLFAGDNSESTSAAIERHRTKLQSERMAGVMLTDFENAIAFVNNLVELNLLATKHEAFSVGLTALVQGQYEAAKQTLWQWFPSHDDESLTDGVPGYIGPIKAFMEILNICDNEGHDVCELVQELEMIYLLHTNLSNPNTYDRVMFLKEYAAEYHNGYWGRTLNAFEEVVFSVNPQTIKTEIMTFKTPALQRILVKPQYTMHVKNAIAYLFDELPSDYSQKTHATYTSLDKITKLDVEVVGSADKAYKLIFGNIYVYIDTRD